MSNERIVDLYLRLARKPVRSKGATKVSRLIWNEKKRVQRAARRRTA